MRIDSIHEEHLFLERTGICRIRGISLVRECVFENGVWMNVDVGVNKFIQGGQFINDTHPSQQELNIETFYPLTSEQRRILKDFIDRYHIPLDKIFIDDHSEEQSVKRQLGIGSIVQQFHR
jgi:hypothetical protein